MRSVACSQAPRGAVEQARTESILDGVDMLGRHGLRDTERTGRGGKTAQGGYLGQHLHSGETVEQAISH